MKQLKGQIALFDLDMSCGKTSPAHTAATKGKTSELCSKNSAASKTVTPIFLDLRTGSGLTRERSWQTGIPSHGEHSTLNTGESPSVVVESTLSQILEANVPLKYYLSARACAGVLNRAQKRGKPLPEILKTALEQQIERWEKTGSPIPKGVEACENHAQDSRYKLTEKVPTLSSKMGQGGDNVPYAVYTIQGNVIDREAKCNGSGIGKDVSPTINTVDRHAVCYVSNSSGNDVSGTIDAHYYLGCGARGGKEREFVCFAQNAYDKYVYTKKCATLRARSGSCGGGSETVVCVAGFSPKASPGSGSVSFQKECSATLLAGKESGVCVKIEQEYVVRRLTPLECCRLQGMPDWWGDGVAGADTPRYKMFGNGMALPNALYVMEGFNEP